MKLKNILPIILAVFAFYACDDDTNPKIPMPSPAVLDAIDFSSLKLVEETADNAVLTLNWEAEEFKAEGYSYSYGIQVDTADNNFANAKLLGWTTDLYYPTLGADLNSFITKNFRHEAETEGKYEFRVIRTANGKDDFVTPIPGTASNSFALAIITYKAADPLYLPGAHNGWDAAAQRVLYNLSTKQYEGYAYLMTDGFKFTSQPNWDGTNYGSGGADGILSSAADAGNLSLDNGMYWITVKPKELSWTHQPVEWTIIGNIVPGTDWNADEPLVFDANKKVLSATINAQVGEFKFRRDAGWDINLGEGSESGVLSQDGSNLKITAAGKYKITLDLTSNPEKYSYTITAE